MVGRRERAGVGGSNSVVESQPSKLLVAGSIPVSRSILRSRVTGNRVSNGWHAPARTLPIEAFEADSSAVARGKRSASAKADVAQLAEHVLGKDEVTSSILVIGSSLRSRESGRNVSFGQASQAKDVSPKR